MTVEIPYELEEYVSEKVSSGLYSSSKDVIGAGIRLLKEQDDTNSVRLQELRQEIDLGLAQADRGELLDGEQFMAGLRLRHEQHVPNGA